MLVVETPLLPSRNCSSVLKADAVPLIEAAKVGVVIDAPGMTLFDLLVLINPGSFCMNVGIAEKRPLFVVDSRMPPNPCASMWAKM